MFYTFHIERATAGQYRLAVRFADGTLLLRSTPLDDASSAGDAMSRLRGSLACDWRYKIVRGRGGGPSFLIKLSDPRAECTSRQFSSGDAMEREILWLKVAAAHIPSSHEHVDTAGWRHATAARPRSHSLSPASPQ